MWRVINGGDDRKRCDLETQSRGKTRKERIQLHTHVSNFVLPVVEKVMLAKSNDGTYFGNLAKALTPPRRRLHSLEMDETAAGRSYLRQQSIWPFDRCMYIHWKAASPSIEIIKYYDFNGEEVEASNRKKVATTLSFWVERGSLSISAAQDGVVAPTTYPASSVPRIGETAISSLLPNLP